MSALPYNRQLYTTRDKEVLVRLNIRPGGVMNAELTYSYRNESDGFDRAAFIK